MQTILKINPDFKALIPPLSAEEFQQLEENIISSSKCRDALVVWNGTIIDGHNRYVICQKHGIPYEVSAKHFPSRKAAVLWILENQLGRRNLTNATRINLAIHKAELTRNQPKTGAKNIRKEIAADAKVSEDTVKKYMKIKAIGDPKLLEKVNGGELKIGTAYNMMQVSTKTVKEILDPEEIQELNRKYQAKAMTDTLCSIEKLYNFALKHIPMDGGEWDMNVLQKLLVAQGRVLKPMACVV